MNWLDLVIVVVVILFVFTGLKTGLIKAALSLAGMVLGIVLAGQFYETLAPQLSFIDSPMAANIAAFAIILFAVILVTSIVAALLHNIVNMLLLGWVNHLGGAVFGFFMGSMLCGSILAAWVSFFGAGDSVSNSLVAQFLLDIVPLTLFFLPEEFNLPSSLF